MTTTEIRTDLSLSIDRVIKAPAEKLFNAWLDPEMLKKFMLPGPDMSLPSAKVDAREGGRFDLIMRDATDDMPHGGVYKKIDPHSQIIFHGKAPGPLPRAKSRWTLHRMATAPK